jgi:glycerol-3-phosphate dehydrogenase subunit C
MSEYLVLLSRAGRLNMDLEPLAETYVVYGHCHQKSLGIGSFPAELLRLVPGVTVHEVEALCCGMVGSFGYKKEYSALSKAIGARLFERINQYGGDVAACGISCRSQIEMGTGRRVVHPVEVVARALRRTSEG